MKEKDEYFKQNGGLQLYDDMRSRKVDTVRILTEKEIKRATDNYNEDRVIGCGGQGMVYKGTLDDQKEVAIKKSKVINNDCREEFVNEIIILSQINHRNIVRLIGCCLDVDVPMLVYEFVSRGTLSEFIHSADHKRSPIPLGLRLKIATQSAEALAYLHSSTSRTILHGDVKSANILLDDQLNAKVADFGASTLKSMDESEFIMFVHGTLGYLDPESFISHCLTDKSDVYSFGVVLLELMTRKRAIYTDNFNEKQSLSYSFPLKFHQKNYRTMLDPEIIEDAGMAVLEKMAELAVHCLRPRGDDRPTMKEVAERLHMIRDSNSTQLVLMKTAVQTRAFFLKMRTTAMQKTTEDHRPLLSLSTRQHTGPLTCQNWLTILQDDAYKFVLMDNYFCFWYATLVSLSPTCCNIPRI
jgi:serine/threonine protein kinase